MDNIIKVDEETIEQTSKILISKKDLLDQRNDCIQEVTRQQDRMKEIDNKLALFEKS